MKEFVHKQLAAIRTVFSSRPAPRGYLPSQNQRLGIPGSIWQVLLLFLQRERAAIHYRPE